MKKRTISFVLCINLLITMLCGRLWTITSAPQSASADIGTRTKEIHTRRGMIYDRNTIPLVNNSYKDVLLIKPTSNALAILKANKFDNTDTLTS